MKLDRYHHEAQLSADRHHARAKTWRAEWQRIVLRVYPNATFWVETDVERVDRRLAEEMELGWCGVGACLNPSTYLRNHWSNITGGPA